MQDGEGRNELNHILVATKEGLEDYRSILSASDLRHAELHFTSDPSLDLAARCNVWFGAPSIAAQLLLVESNTNSRPTPDWIQSTWAGVEPLVKPGMPSNYVLTNMRGIFNDVASEYVLGHIFGYALRIRQHLECNSSRRWNPTVTPDRVAGKTVGILGVGEIGGSIAKSCKAVGLNVYGWTRSSEGCPHVDEYYHGQAGLISMAPVVDYWVCVMPNTPASANTLNKSVFDQMKRGALVINMGRGTAIADDDLLVALEEGVVGAAVLDVFREEPLPTTHPYWSCENVLITSHTAAKTMPSDAVSVFVDNYRRFVAEQDLKYVVDFDRGY